MLEQLDVVSASPHVAHWLMPVCYASRCWAFSQACTQQASIQAQYTDGYTAVSCAGFEPHACRKWRVRSKKTTNTPTSTSTVAPIADHGVSVRPYPATLPHLNDPHHTTPHHTTPHHTTASLLYLRNHLPPNRLHTCCCPRDCSAKQTPYAWPCQCCLLPASQA
jgi:hypothetical protein